MRWIGSVVLVVILFSGPAFGQTTIEKPPDLGDFWFPLSPNGGSFVYADCFIAPPDDVSPAALGTWLNDQGSGGSSVRFEIWGDTGVGGPDASNVLATTGSITPATGGVLTFVESPVAGAALDLTPGDTYWFAMTVVGEAGPGLFNTGGHTQNSVFVDNCTFWFSNDPAGIVFDGQNNTPEMPFSVTLGVDTPVIEIPTMNRYGVLLLILVLSSVGVLTLRRRHG